MAELLLIHTGQQILREFAQKFRRESDFNVSAALTADEAEIGGALQKDLALVVMPLRIPGAYNGLSFAIRVREQCPSAKIIIVETRLDCRGSGLVDAIIPSPLKPNAILMRVRALLFKERSREAYH